MRVAALYDIHANLPALEAALQEIRQAEVDQLVVGGDVLPGPMPAESLRCLLELAIPTYFIKGNGEVAVLQEMAGEVPAKVPEAYRPIIRWNAEQIDSALRQHVAGWPGTSRLEVPGLGAVLFCHATPRNENEIFTRLTPEAVLLPIFERLDVSVVVCGHTHMQFDRRVGATRVVNAGSVGMPFGKPGADWLLLGPTPEFRHTSYDPGAAAQRIRDTAYPQADEFARRYVLNPPSEEEMLRVFAGAGIE